MARFSPTVNAGREIAEISNDFARPIEVLREAVHNSYDAGAREVRILAKTETLPNGSRGLTIEVSDDGHGMTAEVVQNLFGLGHSEKDKILDREPIGYKGHGTKVYYQASEIFILTRREHGGILLAHLPNARADVVRKSIPQPELLEGDEAQRLADVRQLALQGGHGTTIRLVDFTPNSVLLIDAFRRNPVVNYLRWFTIFGSFQHVLYPDFRPPMKLFFQGTDEQAPQEVAFGHDWPESDQTDMKSLKKLDERRPFNYFRKTFRQANLPVQSGYWIDIAAIFEGRGGRRGRDSGIRVQGKKDGLYYEEERYGIWLCKDFIPVEPKFEWFNDDGFPLTNNGFQLPLIFVNCQKFSLTANRGSVGNSPDVLLSAVKDAVFGFVAKITDDDKDLKNFLAEYQEDLFSRLREKDKKALQRRIERYNKKRWCTVTLPGGKTHSFFEPTREITLFGLISELHVLEPMLLELDILDYDDHVGIDMLVRRNGNPSDLLDRSKVSYIELKFQLEAAINHPFDNLHSIICWDTALTEDSLVLDPTGETFVYREVHGNGGISHAHLIPRPSSKLSHTIRVIRLERLLRERCNLQTQPNPRPVRKPGAA